jgi:hypothetical protein
MTWPPRWDGPQFKTPALTKERTVRRAGRRKVEKTGKALVRARDRRCRFPLCLCRLRGYALHVAHLRHKGSGGNPRGDRSAADRMILLCAPRHRESPYSVDKGTLRVVPLNPAGGTAGPCIYEARVEDLQRLNDRGLVVDFGPGEWWELARERAPHELELVTPEQAYILGRIASVPA